MQKLSKKWGSLIISGVVVFLLFLYFRGINEEKRIREEQAQTTAIVTEVKAGYRGGITMIYKFVHNNKSYSGSRKVFISSSYAEKFKDNYFTVVFNRLEPSDNRLLLLVDDFEEFNVTYPDSLEWIEILKRKSL